MHFLHLCFASLLAPCFALGSPGSAASCTNVNVYKPFYLTAEYTNKTEEVQRLIIEDNVFAGPTRSLQVPKQIATDGPKFRIIQGRLVFFSNQRPAGVKVSGNVYQGSPFAFFPSTDKEEVQAPGNVTLVDVAGGCAVTLGGDRHFSLCGGEDYLYLHVVVVGQDDAKHCRPMGLVAVSKPPA